MDGAIPESSNPSIFEQLFLFDRAWTQGFNERGQISYPNFYQEHCTWSHMDWYRESSSSQRVRLRDFLIEFDRQNQVDPSHCRTADIYSGISEIMTRLTVKLGQIDRRYEGKLFGVGSFHNQTKIGEPDEFDFAYELDICKLFDDTSASIIKTRVPNTWAAQLEHLSEKHDLFDCPKPDDFPPEVDFSRFGNLSYFGSEGILGYYSRYQHIVTDFFGNPGLNFKHIIFAFFLTLNRALQELELPKGWSHGGFDRPRYSGVWLNFPSLLIQLHYDGSEIHKPFAIAVDFVPLLKVEGKPQGASGILEDLLAEAHKFCWITCFGESVPTMAEEQFLSEYPKESIPKMLIRICKALYTEAYLTKPVFLTKQVAKQVCNYRNYQADRPSEDKVSMMWTLQHDLRLDAWLNSPGSRAQYATVEDVGGRLNSCEYIPSYIFKLVVMTLMALDPSNAKSWTQDDIGELVLSVFMIINDVIVSKRNFTCLEEFYHERGISLNELPFDQVSVPLGCYFKPQCTSGSTHLDSTSNPINLYHQIREARRKRCCRLDLLLGKPKYWYSPQEEGTNDDLRISQVFKILQSALEGKSHADIIVLNEANQMSRQSELDKTLVRKKELTEMLHSKGKGVGSVGNGRLAGGAPDGAMVFLTGKVQSLKVSRGRKRA